MTMELAEGGEVGGRGSSCGWWEEGRGLEGGGGKRGKGEKKEEEEEEEAGYANTHPNR